MLLNLTDVFTSEGKTDTKTVPLELTEFQCQAGCFAVVGKSPVQIRMSNLGVGRALITGNVSLTLQMSCDRCLTEFLPKMWEMPGVTRRIRMFWKRIG